MTDNEVALGGGDPDAPHSEQYDETLGEMDVSQEEFDAMPGWKRGRISEINEKRRVAESERDELRGERNQLQGQLSEFQKRLSAIEQNGGGSNKPAPEGWAAFTTDKLDGYIRDEAKARRDFMLNPDNEDAKVRFLEFDPAHIQAVNDEKARRIASGLVDGIEKKRGVEVEEQRRLASFQQRLIDTYGPDIGRPGSDLMRAVATEFQVYMQANALSEDQARRDYGGYELAVERAVTKLRGNRGGREDVARRHLAVERGVRREAAPMNSIAALRQKGDWKSVDQAQDAEIGEFLKINFPS